MSEPENRKAETNVNPIPVAGPKDPAVDKVVDEVCVRRRTKSKESDGDRAVSQSDQSNLSIFELVERLIAKETAAKSLSREILQQCAVFMKSRGASYAEIAGVLELSEKTIQRYISMARDRESLNLGMSFQKDIALEFLNNWRARSQRLLMLSYSSDLSAAERLKAICVVHQVDMDSIGLLERLGYLSKAVGEGEVTWARKKERGIGIAGSI